MERAFVTGSAGAERFGEAMASSFRKGATSAEGFGAAAEKATAKAEKGAQAFGTALAVQLKTARGQAESVGSVLALSMDKGHMAAQRSLPATNNLVRQLEMSAHRYGGELVLAGRRGNEAFAVMARPAAAFRSHVGGISEKLEEVASKTDAASVSMGGFMGKMLALQAGRKIFNEVIGASQDLEEYWKKIASEATTFRDSLREVASLKNQGGPNDKVVAGALKLALDTGTTADKAAEAQKAYENVGPAVREKGHYKPDNGMTPEQLEKTVLTEAIRTGRRMGISEDVAGEAIGVAGLSTTFKSPEQAMQKFGGAMKGLSEGKLNYNKGTVALSKAMAKLGDSEEAANEGATTGKVGDFAQAGVYLGALSLGTGTAEQAQHRMVQNSRVLNPDATKPDQQKVLADAGIKPGMIDQEKLITLNRYLNAKGVKNKKDWLAEHGLGTVATREGMEASFKAADVLEGRMGRLKESEATNALGKQTIADNASFMAKDKAAASSRISSISDVMNKVEGVQGPEQFEAAKAAAEERFRLANPSEYHSLGRTVALGALSPLTYLTSGVSGFGAAAENDQGMGGAIPTLIKAGQGVGVDVQKKYPKITSSDYATRAQAFSQAADEVRSAGGDPLGLSGLDARAKQRVETLLGDQNAILQDIRTAVSDGGNVNTPAPNPIGRSNAVPIRP